jgi:hypothetical protein
MAKIRHIAEGDPLPEWFLDTLQEFVSTYVSANFQVAILNPTTLRVPASADNGKVAVAVAKSGVLAARWNVANVDAAAPGGLSVGDHDIYVTGYANGPFVNQTGPPSELDSTNYRFFLVLKANGDTSGLGTAATSAEFYRHVGRFTWDGAAITRVQLDFGSSTSFRYTTTVGDGSATAIVVTHNLGSRDVTVTVRESAAPYTEVACVVEHTSTSTVTLRFALAPASAAYTVLVTL